MSDAGSSGDTERTTDDEMEQVFMYLCRECNQHFTAEERDAHRRFHKQDGTAKRKTRSSSRSTKGPSPEPSTSRSNKGPSPKPSSNPDKRQKVTQKKKISSTKKYSKKAERKAKGSSPGGG